mgnify:CR=1 FL=1
MVLEFSCGRPFEVFIISGKVQDFRNFRIFSWIFARCLPFFFFSSTHPLHTHKPAVQLQDKYLSKASQMSHASVVWHLTRKLAQQIKDVKCRRHQKKSQSAIAATSVVLSSLTEIASAVMVWVAVLRPTAMVCALISGRTMAQTVVREKVRSNQVFFFNDRIKCSNPHLH